MAVNDFIEEIWITPLKQVVTNSAIEYLGIPYTDDDPAVEDWRAEVSNVVAAELTRQGRVIFAPISAWHHIAKKYTLPGTFEYWLKLDEEFIKASKKLLIVTLPGYKESKGVNEEIRLAKKYLIPVEYIDPEPYLKLLEES